MKYEKLDISSGSKYKWILCGIIIGVLLIIIVNFIFSYAKYKSVDSVKLASGTISYENADLNIIAMFKKDDEETGYQPVDEIPANGYVIDDSMSYCKEPDREDDIKNILNYENGKLIVDFTKKGTKCYLYFKKLDNTLANLLKDFTTTDTGTNFSTNKITGVSKVTGPGIGNNGNILYKAEDNDGVSYFFRGQAPNNWVQFANMRWRIIRINGDGSIRIIFQCTGVNCTNITGVETNVESNVAYNTQSRDNTYVGYYYGKAGASSYAEAHTNLASNPSTIAVKVNDWYKKNLADYEDYIDPNAGFCNDRQKVTGVNSSYNSGTGYGTSPTSYAMWGRVAKSSGYRQEQLATLKCGVNAATTETQETSVDVDDKLYQRDLFTKKESKKGNQILDYPIGLITADEVLLAGGFRGTGNSNYFLYTNEYYWTMSPMSMADGSTVIMFYVSGDGSLGFTNAGSTFVGVRPVINLKADTIFVPGGEGTIDNPYVVVTD